MTSRATPAAYVGFMPGPRKFGMICGLCDQGVTPLTTGTTLAEVIRLVRVHQRSEVCS